MAKHFTKELLYFLSKIQNNKHFSISRFGDGELLIVEDKFIDISKKFNGEHKYDPNNKNHKFFREQMIASLRHQNDNYYVGIPCKCCVGEPRFNTIKKLSHQNESNLTWANIFVNSNYKLFMADIIPLFKSKKVVLISHNKAQVNKLPFKLTKHFKVGANAWINDYSTISEICEYVQSVKDHYFLFAAGTFSNLAIYECDRLNTNNTFLDIGSTLDVLMQLGGTRRYLKGGSTLNKTCIW